MTYSTSEALLTWLEELNERAASPDNCPWLPLGENPPSEVYLWAQKGARLMEALVTTEESAQTIVHWITQGIVDPKNVAAALESYPVDFVFYLDDSSNIEPEDHNIGQLSYYWECIVGRAMVLTDNTCGFGEEDKRMFLSKSIDYFTGIQSNDIFPVDSALLKELGERDIWARETIAQWLFSRGSMWENHEVSPELNWVFDDVLMRNPSIHFLQGAIDFIDPPVSFNTQHQVHSLVKKSNDNEQHQKPIDLFAKGAPKLFDLLYRCCDTYNALWGRPPVQMNMYKFVEEQKKFRTTQRDVIRAMIVQHNTTVGVETPIPDDALFEQTLDSSP